MFLLSSFSCSDPAAAGRVDPSMLSDQQRMELFFTPDDYEQSRGEFGGDEDDACTWKRTECNNDGRLTSISWHSSFVKLKGVIDMLLLPPALTFFNLYHQALRGEVNTSNLPENLGVVCIDHTALSGTLDVANLPRKMTEFVVHDNAITAVGDIVNLPETLSYFTIGESNVVQQRIRIGKLPKKYFKLHIKQCGFTQIDFENPADMDRVDWQWKKRVRD